MQELERNIEKNELYHASQQHLGDGMGREGIDLSAARAYIAKVKKQGQHMLAGIATAVVSAGIRLNAELNMRRSTSSAGRAGKDPKHNSTSSGNVAPSTWWLAAAPRSG